MMPERKYAIEEIDRMRKALESMYPFGVSFNSKERSAEVEDRLRTHMQNGTEPDELAKASSEYVGRQFEAQTREQEFCREQRAKAPKPRELKTKEDVIDEWFETSVAQYDGASATASDLFDGFSGHTLKRFANQHAPDGVNIRQKDMERYLDGKGIKSRSAMFAKRYDGVQVIIHGNVRSGNYGT
jgi:hypothetical protein